jgi:hypothetical protein
MMLQLCLCIPVYYKYHVFCCAFGLMLFPWITYVSNNSYAYSKLKCISCLNACGLYNAYMSYVKSGATIWCQRD